LSRARLRTTRVVLVAAVAILAAAALRLSPPVSRSPAALFSLPRDTTAGVATDPLGAGEALAWLFVRDGLTADEAAQAIRAASTLDDRRVPAGMQVRLVGDSTEERPREITLQLSVERAILLSRAGDEWTAREERTPWITDTVVAHAVIRRTLYDALDADVATLLPKRARAQPAWALADIHGSRHDRSRELQDGDRVRVAFERRRLPSGVSRIGIILSAGIQRSGEELQAIRFLPSGSQNGQYYDQSGRSLRAAFLRAPLSFRRISSEFGRRKHPILGEWRAHKGTDYAAGAGTPVRSIGDGTVVFAGRRGGYGNVIEVRHSNGFVSRYGHLRGFATGIRVGSRVSIGSTVGFVGMTGLATAPHLHFEILVEGVQRDPRTALSHTAGQPLAAADMAPFSLAHRLAQAILLSPAGVLRDPQAKP